MSTDEKNQNQEERSTQLPFCPYCMTPVAPGEICPVCRLKQGAYVPASHHLPPGTVLTGRYLIGRVLGEGGFGITYIGCDLRLEMKVAVKEYFPVDQVSRHADMGTAVIVRATREDGKTYSDGMKRFLREARTLARMEKQPEIVMVRDFFEANSTAYIVMEYVDGTSFRELMEQKGGKIPASELLPSIEPLFAALTALHNAGLIHRDISPDNIMLERGQVRLLDFGCARESAGGNATMTVALKQGFAPIEQYQRKNQGPWTDVYALAATIYCCLTGNVPPSSLDRLLDDDVVPVRSLGVDLTPGQQKALMRGMEIQPRKRYQSMEEFHQGLYFPVEPWEDPNRPQQEDLPAGSDGTPATETEPAASETDTVPSETDSVPSEEPEATETGRRQTEEFPVPTADDRTAGSETEPGETAAARGGESARHPMARRIAAAALLILILAVCLWGYSRIEELESKILHSGVDGALRWQILEDGTLKVTGDGDVDGDPDWQSYADEITQGYADITGCTDLSGLFSDLTALECFTFEHLDTGDDTEVSAEGLFLNCPALEQVIFEDVNLSGVISLDRAFAGCTSLMALDLCDLYLSDHYSAEGMLEGCASLAALTVECVPSVALPWGEGKTWTCSSNLESVGETLNTQAQGRLEGERLVYAASGDVSESGTSGDLLWVIDEDGLLTIVGRGDFDGESRDWAEHDDLVTDARVYVTDCVCLDGMFAGMSDLRTCDFGTTCFASETEDEDDELRMTDVFSGCSSLEEVNFNRLDTTGVAAYGMIFFECGSLRSVDLSVLDSSSSRAVDNLFVGCSSLTELDFTGFDCSAGTLTEGMLNDCTSLEQVTVPADFAPMAEQEIELPDPGDCIWVSSDGEICTQIIRGADHEITYLRCGAVEEQGVSGDLLWIIDENGMLTIVGRGDFAEEDRGWQRYAELATDARVYVTDCVDLSGMFIDMSCIRTCDFGTTCFASEAEDELRMTDVFSGCSSLEEVDFSRMDTTGVTAYGNIFGNCDSLRSVDLSALDGSSSWAVDHLVDGCSSLTELDFTGFDCAAATLTEDMLSGCASLEQVTVPANFAPMAEQEIELPDPGDGIWVSSDGEICTEITRGADHEITYLRCGAVVEQGVSEDLLWVIDDTGLLTVTGVGNYNGDGNLMWDEEVGGCIGTGGYATSREEAEYTDWRDYPELVTAGRMYATGLEGMCYMFYGMEQMETFRFGRCSLAAGSDASNAFEGCTALESVDFGGLDTGELRSMYLMFEGCTSLRKVNLTALGSTVCYDADEMFAVCGNLEELDLSTLNTSSAANFISDCGSLRKVTVSAGFGADNDPADLLLPGDGWVNSNGEECTYIDGSADVQMTYTRRE